MRVALVEDDHTYARVLVDALHDLGCEVEHAASRDSALTLIAGGAFDLLVCDLKIPTTDDDLDLDREHGLAVVAQVLRDQPGLPVLVHSAYADKHVMAELVDQGPPAEDLFGSGRRWQMLRWSHKGGVDTLGTMVAEFADDLRATENIQVHRGFPQVQLTRYERRCLQIYARRVEGHFVRVEALTEGLSSARVMKIRITGTDGSLRAESVCKVSSVAEIKDERSRFEYGTRVLGAGCFAGLSGQVTAGAGGRAALFYNVSFGSLSLFDVLETDPESTDELVALLEEAENPWREGRIREEVLVGVIRAEMIPTAQMEELASTHLSDVDWRGFEERRVHTERGPQHRDLHPGNVLLRNDRPIFIDYGELGEGVLLTDPVVLDLSLLFHPQGRALCGDWPTAAEAERWYDLDAYLARCPCPDYVRACRRWAAAAADDPRAHPAVAYSYAARQLRYPDTDKSLARAVIIGSIRSFDT